MAQFVSGRRVAALALVVGFALTLSVVTSAEPLRAEGNAAASASAAAKKALPKHFVGAVTALNQENQSFTLDLGSKKVVVTTLLKGDGVSLVTTKFQTFSGKKVDASFSTVQVGRKVAVVGDLVGSTLNARIVFIEVTKTTKRQADRGTVTALSGSAFSYTSTALKNTAGIVNITDSTVFTKKVGDAITRIHFSDLTIGDRVSFVGATDANGVITAKLVHIIPGTPTTKTATSSAK